MVKWALLSKNVFHKGKSFDSVEMMDVDPLLDTVVIDVFGLESSSFSMMANLAFFVKANPSILTVNPFILKVNLTF